jgi:hypothetical protein
MFSLPASRLALDAIVGVSPPATRWVQLHVGDPGDGSSARAVNSTRKAVAFDSDGLTAASTNDVVWAPIDVTAEERYTHVSVWTQERGGEFLWPATVVGSRVFPGDEFYLSAGQIVVEVA